MILFISPSQSMPHSFQNHSLCESEETEETRGNDLKNKDTWIRAAKDQKNGKKWTRITSKDSQPSQYNTDGNSHKLQH